MSYYLIKTMDIFLVWRDILESGTIVIVDKFPLKKFNIVVF